MSELKSSIVYGIGIYGEYGEIDYDAANALSAITSKYEGIHSIWSGRDGLEPSMIVIGITLEDYDQNEVYVNLKELSKKEKEAAQNFPVKQIVNDIQQCLIENEIRDVDFDDTPSSIIVQVEN